MQFLRVILSVILLASLSACSKKDAGSLFEVPPSQKQVNWDSEFPAIRDAIMHRFYMSNEVNALEDFKKTPAEYALPILVEQYSLHRERRPPETNRNEIALKASQVATQIPGAGTVLRDMCTNFNTGVLTFRFRQYRGDLINCFIYSRTKEAVCFFGTMLNSGTNALGPGTMAQALCYMNIPGAPYGPDQWIDGSQFSAIEKWKVWWEANKSKFTQ